MVYKKVIYIGHIIDRMSILPTRSTKFQLSYKNAHDAAERLLRKHSAKGDERYTIDIEEREI